MATLQASAKSDQSRAALIGASEVTKPAEMAQDPLQRSIDIWVLYPFQWEEYVDKALYGRLAYSSYEFKRVGNLVQYAREKVHLNLDFIFISLYCLTPVRTLLLNPCPPLASLGHWGCLLCGTSTAQHMLIQGLPQCAWS